MYAVIEADLRGRGIDEMKVDSQPASNVLMPVPGQPSNAAILPGRREPLLECICSKALEKSDPAGRTPAGRNGGDSRSPRNDCKLFPGSYFNEVLIEVNWLLRVLPRPFTTAIIASEIPAAIKPYSIAVAPD
jgi:hypothetical protein